MLKPKIHLPIGWIRGHLLEVLAFIGLGNNVKLDVLEKGDLDEERKPKLEWVGTRELLSV